MRAWRSGLRACLPNRRCSVRSRPPAPTCHRLVLRVRRFQRWTSRVELPLAGPNCRSKFLGASPSWPRRRILNPVTAGSSPAALTNSSRGLGREGAGSHKAGVAGSTPVPATIFGGSGIGWTPRCVRRSPTTHYEIDGHSISPDFVQWQDARLWTGRRGVRFSQSGPDTGLVQNAGLQNPMSTVRFSQPVPISSRALAARSQVPARRGRASV